MQGDGLLEDLARRLRATRTRTRRWWMMCKPPCRGKARGGGASGARCARPAARRWRLGPPNGTRRPRRRKNLAPFSSSHTVLYIYGDMFHVTSGDFTAKSASRLSFTEEIISISSVGPCYRPLTSVEYAGVAASSAARTTPVLCNSTCGSQAGLRLEGTKARDAATIDRRLRARARISVRSQEAPCSCSSEFSIDSRRRLLCQ